MSFKIPLLTPGHNYDFAQKRLNHSVTFRHHRDAGFHCTFGFDAAASVTYRSKMELKIIPQPTARSRMAITKRETRGDLQKNRENWLDAASYYQQFVENEGDVEQFIEYAIASGDEELIRLVRLDFADQYNEFVASVFDGPGMILFDRETCLPLLVIVNGKSCTIAVPNCVPNPEIAKTLSESFDCGYSSWESIRERVGDETEDDVTLVLGVDDGNLRGVLAKDGAVFSEPLKRP